MFSTLLADPFSFGIFLGVILLSLSVHEWAHAYAAFLLGDSTAQREGRLTIDPRAHLDLFGTLAFFFLGFGWGKPVPVNPSRFAHPRRGNAIVAFAGPFSNICLAFLFVSAKVLLATANFPEAFELFLDMGMTINALLAVFNLLPVPPLDGGSVVLGFVPQRWAFRVEEFLQYHGPILLFGALAVDMFFGLPLITGPISFLSQTLLLGLAFSADFLWGGLVTAGL